MMDLSRRKLLIGSASVLAVVAVATPALGLPVLWGDGIHDDAPALNALMNGGRAVSPDGVVFDSPVIDGGIYRLESTLHLGSGCDICNARLEFGPEVIFMLGFVGPGNSTVRDSTFLFAPIAATA